ncbi:metalloregulator ArsR/SmtB family transcription factor [Pseudoxanthomonas winnipegensis]|uniref:metalloregulator ArsR/SmtB family transcription factor n=1 Tax=Pseudoxanthomonas winnipegensis TaxID=2480810 RepID=UPI0030F3CBE0
MPARLPSPALDAAAMASHAQAASALLKALAHPARLRVLCRLVEGEASVGELQAKSALSMSALSQHLAVLRQAELVDTRREAQTIFYRLLDSPALGVMQALHAAYCAPAGKTQRPRRR